MKKSTTGLVAPIALAISLASCGGESASRPNDDVIAVAEEYVAEFGCALSLSDAEIELVDMSDKEESLALSLGLSPEQVFLNGSAESDSIAINEELDTVSQKAVIGHEVVHYCTDNSTWKKLDNNFEIYDGSGDVITGVSGFKLIFNDTDPVKDETSLRFDYIEEGVVHWLSEDYHENDPTLGDEYTSIQVLSGLMAEFRGVTKQEVAELLYADNFLGYVAILKKKDVSNVNEMDVNDIYFLYNVALQNPSYFTYQDVTDILNRSN